MKDNCGKKCILEYKTRVGYSGYVEGVTIVSSPYLVRQNLQRWSQSRRKFAFLQDSTTGDNPNNEESHKVLLKHLEMVFPRPSQFEKKHDS